MKLTDVIVEEKTYRDPDTGMPQYLCVEVWADAGMKDVIAAVPGVTNVYNNSCATCYTVFTDPRYDRGWIMAEIEAQIKIHGGDA